MKRSAKPCTVRERMHEGYRDFITDPATGRVTTTPWSPLTTNHHHRRERIMSDNTLSLEIQRLTKPITFHAPILRLPRRVRFHVSPGPYYRDGDWWRATAWDAVGNPVTLVPWEDE